MNDLPIAIRPVAPTDRGYIAKTWFLEFRKCYPNNFIPSNIYETEKYNKLIDSILNKCGVIIACMDDEPDLIAGYLVYEKVADNIIIHYAQTKGIFRRMGIFNTLLEHIDAKDKPLIYSHNFKLHKEFKEKYTLMYDPYSLEKFK